MTPPTTRTYDVLCMGRSSIDLYAHEVGRPITEVRSFDAYVGGCPTNVSVGTRRLGLRTALLTGVGTDQVGDFVLHFLNQEDVDTRYVARFPDRRTSAALLTILPPDRFPLTFYRDNCADLALTLDHVRAAPIGDSRAIFLSGTGLSQEPSRTATARAAEIARSAGTTVVVDVDYRPGLWPGPESFGVHVRALLALADVGIGTEEELQAATGEPDGARAVARLLEGGRLQLFVLKRGAEGCTVFHGNGTREDVPPFRVEILNVLGAGDAFASGFLFGWLAGWPAVKAARFGNAVGAIVVTRHGCANFMPTLDEVRLFMQAQGEPVEGYVS